MASKSNINEIKFNQWDNGVPASADERDLANGWFEYLENVSVGDNTKVLKQVGDVIQPTQSGEQIVKSYSDVNGYIYSLAIGNGGTSDFLDYGKTSSGNWTKVGTGAPWVFTTNPFFVYYLGYIYYLDGSGIESYKMSDGSLAGYVTPGVALSGGVEWQGNLYGWNGQDIWIVTVAGTTAHPTTAQSFNMITIPTDQTIVDLIPYGNLLAIICTGLVESNMYLWDGITTTSFYDIVKIGVGKVVGGVIRDGVITVVIGSLNGKDFMIREYNGNFRTVYYYNGRKNSGGTLNTFLSSKVKISKGFIYFIGQVTRPNSTDTLKYVLFRWGNKITGTANSFCVYNNLGFTSTNLGTGSLMTDFVILDNDNVSPDYVSAFFTLEDIASTPTIREMKTAGTYLQNGIVETGIYSCGDASINKQLKGVSLQYNALNGTGVTMYLRCDDSTPWVEIFHDNTVGSKNHRAVCIESTGANLPTYKEVQFRVEMTGGQTLIGGKMRYEEEIEENY